MSRYFGFRHATPIFILLPSFQFFDAMALRMPFIDAADYFRLFAYAIITAAAGFFIYASSPRQRARHYFRFSLLFSLITPALPLSR